MKNFLILLVTIVGMLAPMTQAKNDTQARKTASPVALAAKKVKKVKNKVNEKADYYILLYSASWCVPCRQEMPEIVEAYKDMKKTGKVDIILFCKDKTPKEAAAYVKQFKMKFLVVMDDDSDAAKVPGYAPVPGIPHCIVVDREGKMITRGHPVGIIPNWEELTIKREEISNANDSSGAGTAY